MGTKKPMTIRKCVLWSLLVIIVSQLTMGVLLLVPVFILKENFPINFVVGMAGITEAIVIFFLIKIINKGRIRPFKNLYKGINVATLVQLFIVGITFTIIASSFVNYFSFLRGNLFYIKLVVPDITLANIFNFIALAILVPVAEEVLFRAFLLHQLLKRYAPVTSILVVGVLFTLAHLFPLSSYFSFFLLGVVTGIVYYKTRSLLACIIIHSILNAHNFFAETVPLENATTMDKTLLIISYLFVVFLFVLSMFKLSRMYYSTQLNNKEKETD